MKSIKLLSGFMLLLVLCIGTAQAQTNVGGAATLDVSVEVLGACEVSTDPVVFPGYDPSAGSTSKGFIHVNCPDGTKYWIALDVGKNYQPVPDARGLANPVATLFYQLSSPSGVVWGDRGMPLSTNTWDPYPAVGIGSSESFPVLGDIPSGQAVGPGFYSDVVNVTVWY